jgi:hypothetical protein
MRALHSITLLLGLSTQLLAEEKLFEGGLSPDKTIGVYMVSANRADIGTYDYPSIEIRREKDHKVMGQLSCDSYLQHFESASEDAKMVWAPNSRFFALLSRGTKTSRDVEVYCVATNTLLTLPDYARAIRQRIPSASQGRYFFAKSLAWRGHDLNVRISGNTHDSASNPADFPDDWYDCTIVIRVESPTKVHLRDVIIHKQPKLP